MIFLGIARDGDGEDWCWCWRGGDGGDSHGASRQQPRVSPSQTHRRYYLALLTYVTYSNLAIKQNPMYNPTDDPTFFP